jgi:toxin YhaV
MQVNGWELFAHPLLMDQLDRLVTAVEKERRKKPDRFQDSATFKVLASLRQLIFVTIPADLDRPAYRQGGTLGAARKHWFRAKFGGQRFRLFFRYDSKAKLILFAWVNDSHTLRTYGSRHDAYAVFGKMLEKGNPPDDWEALLRATRDAGAARRFEAAAPGHPKH